MLQRNTAGALAALWLASCATLLPDGRAGALRGPSPEQGDRCQHTPNPLLQRSCLRARDKAHAYLASVNQGDALCLDPLLGTDMSNCRARTRIEEQDSTAMQLHLIDVDPGSSWASRANQSIWIENTALIDMALREKGF